MVAGNYTNTGFLLPSEDYCSECGGYKHSWIGTLGSGRACEHYKDKEVASGTMPLNGTEQAYSDGQKPLTKQQRQRLWLVERRNQEMKRAWKKDQLYNSRQQMRI